MSGHLPKALGDRCSCPSLPTAFLGDLGQARCRLPMVLSHMIPPDNPVCVPSASYLHVCEMERVVLWSPGARYFPFSAKENSHPSSTSLPVWWPCPRGRKSQGDCSGKSKTKGMIHLFSCTRSLPKAGATQGKVLTSQRCVRGKQAQPFPSTFPALKRGVDAFQPQSGRRMVPTSQLFFLRLEGSYQSK